MQPVWREHFSKNELQNMNEELRQEAGNGKEKVSVSERLCECMHGVISW